MRAAIAVVGNEQRLCRVESSESTLAQFKDSCVSVCTGYLRSAVCTRIWFRRVHQIAEEKMSTFNLPPSMQRH